MENRLNYPYENPVEPAAVGMSADRLASVVKRFESGKSSGAYPGGQLVLRRQGKLVLNNAVGIARGLREQENIPAVPVNPRTPFPVLSAGKPLAAIAMAMLEERGLLDIDAPIAHYFPAFSKYGKDQITTLDVLTHRSGILMPDFVRQPHLWTDREAVQEALVETIPSYPRGTLAYHPHEYGWVLSELILRIDGRNLADFFAQEISQPLELPALQFGLAGRELDSLAFTYWLGKPSVVIAGVNVAETYEEQNSTLFFEAKNPATSLVTDAASLAAFYDFLLRGGLTPSGQQLLSEKSIRNYTSREVFSWDRTLKALIALGRGFILGTLPPSSYGWWNTGGCFGHQGGFSCLAFADYQTNISAAILTNGTRSSMDILRRLTPLANGLRKACRK
jgi:CubicO group peptidase (beta-lactamase class C family)